MSKKKKAKEETNLKESGHEKLLFLFFDPEDVGDMFILTLH
jgi:hypothetical protein